MIMYFKVFSFKVKVINKENDLPGPRICTDEPQDTYPEDQDLQGRLEGRRWPTMSWSCQVWALALAIVVLTGFFVVHCLTKECILAGSFQPP